MDNNNLKVLENLNNNYNLIIKITAKLWQI